MLTMLQTFTTKWEQGVFFNGIYSLWHPSRGTETRVQVCVWDFLAESFVASFLQIHSRSAFAWTLGGSSKLEEGMLGVLFGCEHFVKDHKSNLFPHAQKVPEERWTICHADDNGGYIMYILYSCVVFDAFSCVSMPLKD